MRRNDADDGLPAVRRRVARILPALVLAAALAAGAARADVNMTGDWDVQVYGTSQPFRIVQSGTALTADSNNSLYYWEGSIDLVTRAFTLVASDLTTATVLACGVFDATLSADATTFAGSFATALLMCSGPPFVGPCVCGTFDSVPVTGVRTSSPTCGNGAVETDEQCDDGNLQEGDCCTASCHFAFAGASCTPDASPCSVDQCDGAGTCKHGPSPLCLTAAGKTAIRVRGSGAKTRVRALWSDASGAPFANAFGDPRTLTELRLCVFSDSNLILDAVVPPAACGAPPCWSLNGHGYKYRAPRSAVDGITRIELRDNGSGRVLVDVRGRGSALPFVADAAPPLRALIMASDIVGTRCWDVE